jgi:hypothetical protein
MAPFPPSDTLTSITPPSFIDDGRSFQHRMPRFSARSKVNQWLEAASIAPSASSTTDTSAYTGSFVDDGADMLVQDRTNVPGFGNIDRRFYEQREKKSEVEEEWTEDLALAVGGEIFRNLTESRGLGDLQVVEKTAERKQMGKSVRKAEDDGGVWVKAPITWGAFVIEGEDGRIVVVDADGEYDSGGPGEVAIELGMSKGEKEEEKRKKREVRKKEMEAAAAKRDEEAASRRRDADQEKRRHIRGSTTKTKSLTCSRQTETFEVESVAASNAPSLTKFFATGAASGYLSPVPVLEKPSASPTRSPPGAWPSPVLSPVKQSSEVKWDTGSPTHSASASAMEPAATWKTETWDEYESGTKQSSVAESHRTTRTKSSHRSLTRSGNGWEETKEETWEEYGSTTKQPSIVTSHRSTRTRSSHHSHSPARPGDGWGAQKDDPWAQDSIAQLSRSPTKSVISHASSGAGSTSRGSWKRDVEDFQSRGSPTTVITRAPSVVKSETAWDNPMTTSSWHSRTSSRSARSIAASTAIAITEQTWDKPASRHSSSSSQTSRKTSISHNTPSFSAWNAPITEDNTKSTHSSRRSSGEGSQVSTVQPFSWRREVEEQSTCSTVGSPGSRSDAASVTEADTWKEEDDEDDENMETWNQDADSQSVRSTHSTYHHPTVESAPTTPAEELQEWGADTRSQPTQAAPDNSDSGWGDRRSEAGGDQTATWNGSQGSAKSRRDKSGYGEDNETWLNTEVGGVRFREAEWRRPGALSWRDV